MRVPIVYIELALGAFSLVGCAQSTTYPLRLFSLTERELLDKATVVVIGTTSSAQWEGKTVPISWARQPGVSSVQLVRLKIAVERTLRGTTKDDQITVCYWAAAVFTNASSLNLPAIGQRGVHYLVSEHGTLRYVTDVVRSATVVFSGRHQQMPKSNGSAADVEIARTLLTPSEDMAVSEFTEHLRTATADSLQLVGFSGSLPLLRVLEKSSRWELKWNGCVQLMKSGFMGQGECIDRLSGIAEEHSKTLEFRALQAQRGRAETAFKRAFLANPVGTAKDYALLPGTDGIVDFLRLITQHPDKELSIRAQSELDRCCANR
jgi:hypothetical protein